ncbi:formylglycine-generating enzyme family protein [Ruegeria faecimaris]|uniref:formylglycine-generating enzyme family protein n=1 Tax=Ruegeria faecimaris TaxID=686389 RepID=UPI00232BCCBF|nr:formylglycine-generating enzyme family protein [Ruegeria faecimaris]
MGERECCVPNRENELSSPLALVVPKPDTPRLGDTVLVPAGSPITGTAWPIMPDDGEELRKGKVKALGAFRIGATTVSNLQFQDFVEDTGYITEAERIGWSFVFWHDVPKDVASPLGVDGTEWWRHIEGANWRNINGPGTFETAWRPDHPVVQVSWNDAKAYARWAGGRLPTEVEWEHAARGGLGDVKYPWGNMDPNDTDFFPCNIWQGRFPQRNTGADGYRTTAPAASFEPNGYGLYNVVGNVWEWTADPFRIPSLKKSVREKIRRKKGFRLLKGGSFLCHATYCWRYRIAARSGNSPDSATTHQGFRVVFDA